MLGGALTAAAGYALGGDSLYGLEVYYKNGKADLIENIDYDAYKHIINCINKRIVGRPEQALVVTDNDNVIKCLYDIGLD